MKSVNYIIISVMLVFNTASCQSIKVSTVNGKSVYHSKDSLNVEIFNRSKDSVRYFFGLECYFENEWSEIDNDIFRKESKENYFFGLKSKSSILQKISLSDLDIDSIFFGKKYRIVVNVLPVNSFKYQAYYLPVFEIN